MRLNFKQGIISADKDGLGNPDFITVNGSFLMIDTTNEPAVITLAHGTTNYLHSENTNINAWNIPTNTSWLYWDIDPVTAQRTFGITEVEPTYGTIQPTAIDDQHWFDTASSVMYVYNASLSRWQPRIRLFAAKYESGSILYYPFGSQVGIQATSPLYSAGRILYDIVGQAIQHSDGTFLTTEDELRVNGTLSQGIRLESNTVVATALESISAFSVVKYSGFGKVELADYEDIGTTVLAMATNDGVVSDSISLIIQGVVTNTDWNWSTVGAPLWVDVNGELTLTDPHSINSSRLAQVPVARVLSTTSIIFEQGLGGKGEQGVPGNASTLATDTVSGIVRLATPADDSLDPIAVGNNDPRLTDARIPLTHTHQAVDISVTPYGSIVATNVQAALEEMDGAHLPIAGGTMTGSLILDADPTLPLGASTKQYVDSLVSGLRWIDPVCLVNLISDALTTPPGSPEYSDAYVVGTGGSGAWSGLDDHIVIWDGTQWLDRGSLLDLTEDHRFGISLESGTTAGGTFVGHDDHIAIWDHLGQTWSFYVPALNDAVWVCSELSLHAFHQYAYNGTNWVEFGGTQAITPGLNLEQSGSTLNVVDWSAGGSIDAATLQGYQPVDFAAVVHNHDSLYYTKTELDAGQLDTRYYTETESDALYAPIVHEHNIPFAIPFFVAGNMVATSTVVGSFVSVRSVAIDSTYPTSQAFCRTPPAVSTVYSLEKFGVGQVATITFDPGSNIGTIAAITGDFVLAVGDVLELITPTTLEGTIADISVTIEGCITATACTAP